MPTSLSYQARADLYEALYRCAHAGMAGDRMLRTAAAAAADGATREAMRQTTGLVAGGKPLAAAGAACGLFTSRDRLLLQAAERIGETEQVLQRLATFYRHRASRARRVKSKLAYPVLLLVVAVLLAPLPALLSGGLSMSGYLGMTIVPLGLLALAARLGTGWLNQDALKHYPRWLALALLKLPFAGRLVVQRARVDMLDNLAMFVCGGVPAMEAITAAVDVVRNPVLQDRFRQAEQALHAGNTVADALRSADIIDAAEGHALLSAAEHAGRLEQMCQRHAELQTERLNATYDLLAEWFPRVVYVLVVGWIAYTLV